MALLIDSNIVIYSISQEFHFLRTLLVSKDCYVSEISCVEVLGYHGLNDVDRKFFLDVFDYISIITPDQTIFDKAIEIRRRYKLKLGDSIIAATAIVHELDLYTHNVKDFKRVEGINYIDPIAP